jgi:hypothetical protein
MQLIRDCESSGVPTRTRKTFRGGGQGLAKHERRLDGFGRHFRLDPFSRQPDAVRWRTGPLARRRRSRRAQPCVWRVADRRFGRAKQAVELVRPHTPSSGYRACGSLPSCGRTSCTAEALVGSMRISSLQPLSPTRLSGQRTSIWPGWPANSESHTGLAAPNERSWPSGDGMVFV